MNLIQIERGMKMTIYEDLQMRPVSEDFEAVFRQVEGDRHFVVLCPALYDSFARLQLGASLRISFTSDPNIYTFTGRAKEKQRTRGLVLIEQLTDIETLSSRKYDRDEFRMRVMVYGLPESKLSDVVFEKPQGNPDMSDLTYDISAGGLCVVSNTLLSSKHDPYYAIEFMIGDKDRFVLPAKLVRRSNYPRVKVGKYDYGFQFIFDKMPDEKGRLSRAILSKKLAQR